MGQITLGEQASPVTPASGVVIYATIATPSLTKIKNDSGSDLTVSVLEAAQTFIQSQSIANQDAGSGANAGWIAGRNSNVSTPAPGYLRCVEADNGDDAIYPDDSGIWRTVSGAAPTNATFAAGTVIGSQTSMAKAKNIDAEHLSVFDDVMDRIRVGAAAVRKFTYKDGRLGGEEFEGVVVDLAPAYGTDRDPDNPSGKCLNEILIPADLLRFAVWAMDRIENLTQRLEALEGKG